MLVLSRKIGESIIINDNIEIKIIDIRKDAIKIGIKAPKDVSIIRKELIERIKQENTQAQIKKDKIIESQILKKLIK